MKVVFDSLEELQEFYKGKELDPATVWKAANGQAIQYAYDAVIKPKQEAPDKRISHKYGPMEYGFPVSWQENLYKCIDKGEEFVLKSVETGYDVSYRRALITFIKDQLAEVVHLGVVGNTYRLTPIKLVKGNVKLLAAATYYNRPAQLDPVVARPTFTSQQLAPNLFDQGKG